MAVGAEVRLPTPYHFCWDRRNMYDIEITIARCSSPLQLSSESTKDSHGTIRTKEKQWPSIVFGYLCTSAPLATAEQDARSPQRQLPGQ